MVKAFRNVLLVTAALLIALPGAAFAQDEAYVPPAEELVEAKVIIEAMFPADKREQVLLDMASSLTQQAASGFMSGPIYEEPGIKAIMDAYIADLPDTFRPLFAKHLPQIFEATAIAYTREFTLDELKDISEFARTPSGQRYFISLQKFQSDPAVAKANQNMFVDLAPIQQAAGAKLMQQVEAYLVANPDVIRRLEKAGVGR